ncbi:Hypothetical_protein [Hexamita inflata]|uniref:Hypothetical_protein n=1 Tax=Hexamita inflata TaxID=28002 RepID=A0AA86PZE9_9EUKA|nr:Hypothetical protein HINF_LOCUS31327 [Hexamita inflata]
MNDRISQAWLTEANIHSQNRKAPVQIWKKVFTQVVLRQDSLQSLVYKENTTTLQIQRKCSLQREFCTILLYLKRRKLNEQYFVLAKAKFNLMRRFVKQFQ